MITYQYSEFQPGDESSNSEEKLMSILSEIILQNDISLEEALKYLIEKGIPANLFLKNAGMDDLLGVYLNKLKSIKEEILSKLKVQPHLPKIEKENQTIIKKLSDKHLSSDQISKIEASLKEKNSDKFRRMKWEENFPPNLIPKIDQILENLIDYSTISEADKKYKFTGSQIISRKETILVIRSLEELEDLIQSLSKAMIDGDLTSIDLKSIASVLGAESYQEFIERRDRIYEQIKKLLENNGKITVDEEGDVKLSPSSLRKIGKKILGEVFSLLKPTDSSHHPTNETGDSENILSKTKPLEFGDNLAHLDYSGSIVNSMIRKKDPHPSLIDMDVFYSRGNSRSSTVILLDMSGSMSRGQRFYNAKKVTLALEALIQNDYKDDKLTIVGFGSTAKVFPIRDIPTLNPYPVTIYDPHIRLKYDFSKLSKKEIEERVPLYFTNLQKGLNLSRQILGSAQIKNKQILLITDGAPTAHFDGNHLFINYPPSPADFEAALNEVKICKDENITINTFLLTNEWDFNYFGEKSFIKRFASISEGRIFYPHPKELNKMILYDFVSQKKKKLSF